MAPQGLRARLRVATGLRDKQRAVAPGAQGLVEYGLILALTAVLTVVILTVFGGVLAEVLELIADAIEAST